MSSGIYQIENTINNKIYIGSSKNINKRWKRHLKDLRKNIHINIKLQRSYDKHGEIAFILKVLEIVEETLLLKREQHYLNFLKPYENGYNIGRQASGGDNLTNHPRREQIIRSIAKGVVKAAANRTNEQKAAHSKRVSGTGNANFGNRWNEKQREDASKRMKERARTIGTSKKTRKKMSKCAKQRWQDRETREKMLIHVQGKNNPFYGKTHSDKTKKILSGEASNKYWSMSKSDYLKKPNVSIISINGKFHLGLTPAAKYLGITAGTLISHCNSLTPRCSQFYFVDKKTLTTEQINSLIWDRK